MPSRGVWTKTLLIASLLVCVALSAAAQDARAQQFTKRLNIETKGMTLRYAEGWTLSESKDQTSQELLREVTIETRSDANAAALLSTGRARMQINTEPRLDHADGLQRLREIAAEYDGSISYLNIGGWPALQRRYSVPLARRGEAADEPIEMAARVTTAIAADDRVIRIETFFPPGANKEVVAEVEAIGRTASFAEAGDVQQTNKEIQTLRASPPLRSSPYAPPHSTNPGGTGAVGAKAASGEKAPAPGKTSDRKSPAAKRSKPAASSKPHPLAAETTTAMPTGKQDLPQEITNTGLNRFVHQGVGELEVAVANNGSIVIAANSGFSNSTDGGQTFTFRGGTPGPNGSVDGDPSLGVGVSGAIYYGFIGFPDGTPAWNNQSGCSTGISVSTNNGANFTFRNNAVLCPQSGMGVCFPDQEHITADRFNAASTGDQVYSVWRNFTPSMGMPNCGNLGSGFVASMLVCSSNGGTSWPTTRTLAGGADMPRVTVGQDGFVYVVYRNGGNINLEKFSSCANGLNLQASYPQTIAAVTDVTCPVPGLDRCNDGNILSSHTVAVDDLNANHVYAAYATNTGAGNENIIVRDSTNGGMSWPGPRAVTLNAPVAGRRFMPWVATVGGIAHVSWYDRRAGVGGTSNDLTDFFRGSASLDGGGNLVAGPEIKITQAADPHCASGWPCAPRATGDSEQCSVQPQNAGVCKLNPVPMPDTSSNRRCDFSNCPGPMCPCNAGEICQGGGGCPKYGDYNGIGAGAGRVVVAWSSATRPPGLTPLPPAGINVYTSVDLVCCVPQIQIPANPNFADTCVGSTSVATLNVCNTGKADLEVNSVTSSNSQFAATTPSSGFPVVISPDFCFPFEMRFTPTSTGSKTTTLTVSSNDPVNPSVTRTVTAQGQQPGIATIIADAGNFGDVCVGKFKDLALTINNNGGCDLRITGITSSSGEFQTAGVMSFPLVIHPGDSLQIPIRFQPTSFGAKTASITLNSNDPLNPAKAVSVSGNAPSATIVVNDPIVFDKTCPGNTNNKTLTIGNSGGCDLIVTGITSSSPEFKVVGVVPFPIVIPPGSTRDVTIQFMPMGFTVDPMRMAILTIMSNDLVTPNKMVKVIGTVPPPVIQVMPDPLDFGKVCLGNSKELPLTILNTGECNLTVSGIGFSSPEFKLVSPPTFPFVIPPGGSRVVTVSFMPVMTTGPRMEKMTINSDDPATPMKMVTLKGIAPVSDIAISGPTDFGTVMVGSSRQQVLNIFNPEPCDLLITLVCEVNSTGIIVPSTEFNLATVLAYPVLIPGGGTLPVTIRFRPDRKGPRTANLIVCGYDPKTPGVGPPPGACPMFSNILRTVPLTGKGK